MRWEGGLEQKERRMPGFWLWPCLTGQAWDHPFTALGSICQLKSEVLDDLQYLEFSRVFEVWLCLSVLLLETCIHLTLIKPGMALDPWTSLLPEAWWGPSLPESRGESFLFVFCWCPLFPQGRLYVLTPSQLVGFL